MLFYPRWDLFIQARLSLLQESENARTMHWHSLIVFWSSDRKRCRLEPRKLFHSSAQDQLRHCFIVCRFRRKSKRVAVIRIHVQHLDWKRRYIWAFLDLPWVPKSGRLRSRNANGWVLQNFCHETRAKQKSQLWYHKMDHFRRNGPIYLSNG